jgi:hypothetical protein
MSVLAPEKFAQWMATHEHVDKKLGFVYRYHPRSDAHSIALCRFILEDLLDHCESLREQGLAGRVIYGINHEHQWPRKKKTLDLAIGFGTPDTMLPTSVAGIYRGQFGRVLIACECKTAMTEHSKSQPRIYDELSSSHEIVHQNDREAIALGVAVVNIAETFVSPLRQKGTELHISKHKQPVVTEKMVKHLASLPMREDQNGTGFDAFACIVIDCDNQKPATLWTQAPSPQPGDPNHYATFVTTVSLRYADWFGKQDRL